MPRYPDMRAPVRALRSGVFSAVQDQTPHIREASYRVDEGDSWLEPPPAALVQTAGTRQYRYAPPRGMPELLSAIRCRLRARHGAVRERAELQVVSGATSGLSVTCQAILAPGDQVLILSPYWPLIRGIVASIGAEPIEVPFYATVAEDDVCPAKALERLVSKRTVAIYVNTPNNPTGRILCSRSLEAIEYVATRHDLWILADEVYEDLTYVEAPAPPLWRRPALKDRTLAIHSLSKTYALAGARVGFVHGPAHAISAIGNVYMFHAYCAATPMQRMAARALSDVSDWLTVAREHYRVAARMTSIALGIPPPEGGTFVFVDARRLASDGSCRSFLRRCYEAGVALTPGDVCGRDFAGWFRLCFTAIPPADLEKALEILRRLMSQ